MTTQRLARIFLAPALPLLVLVTGALTPSPSARADETFTFVVQKQEAKKATRWSLAEWLETRDRMRLMDLWLALHSPSPYEFFIEGAWVGDSGGNGSEFKAAAYARIFGLEYQREVLETSRWRALFNLRFFGFQNQGTNITAHFGIQSTMGANPQRSTVLGPELTLYLARVFGIQVLYRHAFAAPASDRLEFGAFLDFSFVRVFGQAYSETFAGAGLSTGWAAGGRLYF